MLNVGNAKPINTKMKNLAIAVPVFFIFHALLSERENLYKNL